jgi:hypothetical protein
VTRLYLIYVPISIMCFQCSISWHTTRAKKINSAVLFLFLTRQMEVQECIVIIKTSTLLQFMYCSFHRERVQAICRDEKEIFAKIKRYTRSKQTSMLPHKISRCAQYFTKFQLPEVSKALSYKSMSNKS